MKEEFAHKWKHFLVALDTVGIAHWVVNPLLCRSSEPLFCLEPLCTVMCLNNLSYYLATYYPVHEQIPIETQCSTAWLSRPQMLLILVLQDLISAEEKLFRWKFHYVLLSFFLFPPFFSPPTPHFFLMNLRADCFSSKFKIGLATINPARRGSW